LQLGGELRPAVQIGGRELLQQLRFKLGASCYPLLAPPLGCLEIEGNTVRCDLIADRRDVMLELQGLLAVTVRLQEFPDLLTD
jgi:hypothetical protein